MNATNVNIRTDKELKNEVTEIYEKLGLNLTTAVNMFFKATIRENGIPFSLKLDEPNDVTASAITEGRKIAEDKNAKGYHDINDLRKSLGV